MAIDLSPPPPADQAAPPPIADARPPGRTSDTVFRWFAFLGAFLVLAILALILYSTTQKAWPAFRSEGLDFITKNDWDPAKGSYGALAFVYGTLVTSFIAVVFAVPVSLGIALFATEIAPAWARKPIVYVLDLLAVIPSVVYGLWGFLVLAPAILGVYQNIASAVSGIPVLDAVFAGDPISGLSFMTGGLILAIMIVPIVTSISREVFVTTPPAQKEAAFALGATRWEMIRAAVLPHSRAGVTSAVLIGLGRALGETIAVALVIGSLARITPHMFTAGYSMPAVIVNQWSEAQAQQRSALIGLGVVLFVMTLVVGVIARAIVARSDRRLGIVR